MAKQRVVVAQKKSALADNGVRPDILLVGNLKAPGGLDAPVADKHGVHARPKLDTLAEEIHIAPSLLGTHVIDNERRDRFARLVGDDVGQRDANNA